jgi:hypothetical protein
MASQLFESIKNTKIGKIVTVDLIIDKEAIVTEYGVFVDGEPENYLEKP